MTEKAQIEAGATDARSGEDAPNKGSNPESSGARRMSDEAVEAEIDEEEAEIEGELAGGLADNVGASHEGGMGAQGGQTDFGHPRKFGGAGN